MQSETISVTLLATLLSCRACQPGCSCSGASSGTHCCGRGHQGANCVVIIWSNLAGPSMVHIACAEPVQHAPAGPARQQRGSGRPAWPPSPRSLCSRRAHDNEHRCGADAGIAADELQSPSGLCSSSCPLGPLCSAPSAERVSGQLAVAWHLPLLEEPSAGVCSTGNQQLYIRCLCSTQHEFFGVPARCCRWRSLTLLLIAACCPL